MFIGYFVVILPDRQLWQGIPIPQLDSTPAFVQSIRDALPTGPATPQVIITDPPLHVPLEDVPTLSVLQAMTLMAVIESDMEMVITASAGIGHLLGSNFFWLSGIVEPQGGVSSEFAAMPVDSIEAAQALAPHLPAVMAVAQPSPRSAYDWR